ncbi:MAG: D-alanyl-D-alanine carboxypeptidase [Lachnospiraceae bacterium]|nr:D-alanyl-D-alanine carboxypeptidase [Lachnospiraceae bacterium]
MTVSIRWIYRVVLFFTLIGLIGMEMPVRVAAAVDHMEEAEERKSIPIESNSYVNWPAGPVIGAESAILMEANSGTILYEKNINERLYPASITKLLTALVAVDNSELDEMVTFSEEAVHSINWYNDANIGISPGNSITMEQCLYGLLVGSANEVAYAIAEHVSGNVDDFVDLMNKKAEELGCTNSHFVTTNGIHDPEHYTSAHDMALIAKAFFSNEMLAGMSCTTTYHIPQSDTQPRDDMIVYAKSKLHKGKEYAYEGLVGTKTGYTDYARQTLVSCAKRNNLKLICVILKEEAPYQYTDTIELFNYGFDNFKSYNIADNDKTYMVKEADFMASGESFFDSDKLEIEIDDRDYVVVPVNVDFDDLTSEISYEDVKDTEIAHVYYYFGDIEVGRSIIRLKDNASVTYDFGYKSSSTLREPQEKIWTVNIIEVLLIVIGAGLLVTMLVLFKNRMAAGRIERRRRKNSRKYDINGTAHLDWKHFK